MSSPGFPRFFLGCLVVFVSFGELDHLRLFGRCRTRFGSHGVAVLYSGRSTTDFSTRRLATLPCAAAALSNLDECSRSDCEATHML